MDQAETTAKLVALHKAVGRLLEDPRDRYFDPAVVSEFFERWSPIRDALRLGFQSVLGDLPVRAMPVSSGTTDHEGRGYIIRQAIDQLHGDMQYALDALAAPAFLHLDLLGRDGRRVLRHFATALTASKMFQ